MIYLVSNASFAPNGVKLGSVNDLSEFIRQRDELGVDTETTGGFNFQSTILTVQVGDSKDQFVIDAQYLDPYYFKGMLENSNKKKLFQNASFDIKFFRQLGILPWNVYDTFLAELIINCGVKLKGFSLDVLSEKYTNISMSKDPRGKIKKEGLTEEVIKYAAKDVEVLPEVKRKQEEIIANYKLGNVLELENRAVLAISEMEYSGIEINYEYLKEVAHEDLKDLESTKQQLDEIIKSEPKLNNFVRKQLQTDLFREPREVDINYNSQPQVKKAISQVLDQEVEDTSKPTLTKLKNQHQFIEKLLSYRSKQKLTSNYGLNLLDYVNPITKRIHTSFWQVLNTGRISSGQRPKYKGDTGAPNMQNIPSDNRYRNFFRASKGYKLVMSDYSSQELALIADDSQDPVWLDTISKGYDLHTVMARKVFKEEWENGTEKDCEFISKGQKCSCKIHKQLRTKVKTVVYALAYGAGASKIADTLNISVNEAGNILEMFFSTFPALKTYFESIKQRSKDYLRIRTFPPFNRARFFSSPGSYAEVSEIEREGTNTRIQGTGADIIKLAMVHIYDYIHKNNYPARILLQVHDELITEVREDKAEEWSVIKENLMKTASDKVTDVPIEVESKISDKWEK